jgi:hypothetical protein
MGIVKGEQNVGTEKTDKSAPADLSSYRAKKRGAV